MNTKHVLTYIAFFTFLTTLSYIFWILSLNNYNDFRRNDPYLYNTEKDTVEILSNSQLKSLIHQRKCEYIDAVFTWVNGSDPIFTNKLIKFNRSLKNNRYNDYGTLRFSVRSVINKVSNLRNIYIVTNGQKPSWLNTYNPRVKLIKHKDIFTGSHRKYLPTFNSNSIELHLLNIPNLSECFLYMNDDFIIKRNIGLNYFIDDDNQTQSMNLYFDRRYVAPRHRNEKGLWHARSTYTNTLINKHYHPKDLDTEHRYTCHNAYFFRKTILNHIYSIWGKELNMSASHRFRNPKDAVITFMHNNVALEEGLGKPAKCGTQVIWWGNDHKKNVKNWNSISKGTHTLCIQDIFTNTTNMSYYKEVKYLEKKLCRMYPKKSFAEISRERNPCIREN